MNSPIIIRTKRHQRGLSLIEILLSVAILGIMAALLVPYVSPMRGTASVQVARQQQAQLQTALGSWIAQASSGPGGLATARATYNGAGNKLALLEDYLQPSTYAALSGNGNAVSSEALTGAGASLQFSSWGVASAPTVSWIGQ